MNDNDRKLNYLIANINKKPPEEETELLKWLRENKYELIQLIDIKNAFQNKGITLDDTINQIDFGREFKALQAFELEYKKMQNSNIVSTSPGTFVFERKMLREFSTKIGRLPDAIPNGGLFDYKTGMLTLTLPTNRILNSGTLNYFNSSSSTGNISILQTDIGPLMTMRIKTATFTLQGQDSRILNFSQLTKVIQQHTIVWMYRIIGQNVIITSLEGVLDINDISISLEHSQNSMTIPFSLFLEFMFDLPPSVKLLVNIFATDFTEHYLAIKELYTSTLIKELIPQMRTHYNTVYGESPSGELSGQSAAVAISQLYTFSESVIRSEQVDYELDNGVTQLDNPRYLSPVPDTSQFILNLPRHRFDLFGLIPDNNNGEINAWTTNDVGIKYEAANFSLSTAIIGTPLQDQRPETKKANVLKSTRSRDTYANAWLEEIITNYSNVVKASTTRILKSIETGETITTGNYLFEPIAGGNRQRTVGNGTSAIAIIYGLSLRVKNLNPNWKVFEYTIRERYTCTATIETKVILYPDDLSSESTNPLTANITWKKNATSRTVRTTLIPQRILYGNSEINAYVGTVLTEQKTMEFEIDSTVTFDSERGTWAYGNIYRGNNLSQLLRTGEAGAFNTKPSQGTDEIAIIIASNEFPYGKVYRHVPGTVENSNLFRVQNRVILSSPMDWPNYGNGVLTTDIISCYLSLSSKLESTVISPVYVENDAIDLVVTGEEEVNMQVFGYTNDLTNVHQLLLAKRNTVQPSGYFLIKGFTHMTLPSTDTFTLVEFSGRVTELLLPSGVENQFALSESLILTRQSIKLLVQYADYLNYLLITIDKRLQHVEKTMDEIIKTIDKIIQTLTPKTTSFGSQLLMFLGTSVGMFFPLCGLAINIIGQLYSGFEDITDGNLSTGVMDIAIGCLMSVLGIRKFKQRMDRKYGATTEISPPQPPGRLPSYEELFGPPGFNTVGTRITPPSYDSIRLASGVVKNSNITYSDNKVIIDTVLLQQGLYNSYLPITLASNIKSDANCVIGKVIEIWDNAGNFESISYLLYVQQLDINNNVIESVINDQIFKNIHNTAVSVFLYVKYLFVYGNLGEQVSTGFGLDPEVLSILSLSNFSINPNQTNYTNWHSEVKHIDKLSIQSTQSQNNYNAINSVLSISDFADVMNPNIRDEALTSQVYTNAYSFISGSDN